MKQTFLAALLCAVSISSGVLAQNPPPPQPPQLQITASNAVPRPLLAPNRPVRSNFEDSLAPEVKEKYKALREDATAKEKPVREQLRKARTELDALVRAAKPDEDAIVKKALLIGQNEGELALIRARTNAKYREILSPEQAEKLINPFKMNERVGGPTNSPVPHPAPAVSK